MRGHFVIPVVIFSVTTLGVIAACGDDTPVSKDPNADVPTRTPTPPSTGTPPPTTPPSGLDSGVPTGPFLANGRVIDQMGQAISGANIVSAMGQTTSATDGTFHINVQAPYNLVVTVNGDQKETWAYVGLTATAPIITADNVFLNNNATISGTQPTTASGQESVVIFAPTNFTSTFGDFAIVDHGSFYELDPFWFTQGAAAGKVWLFQYTIGTSTTAASYLGFASADTSFSNGEDKAIDFPPLTVASTVNISAVVTFPIGYTKGGGNFGLVRMPGSPQRLPVNQDLSALSSFSLPVPTLTGGTYMIGVHATRGGEDSYARRVVALSGTVNIPLAEAPALSLPTASQTAVNVNSAFTWNSAGGVHIVEIRETGNNDRTFVVTTGNTADLATLTAVGVQLTHVKSYSWQVTRLPNYTTTDALVGATPVDTLCVHDSGLGSDEETCAISEVRTFSTN